MAALRQKEALRASTLELLARHEKDLLESRQREKEFEAIKLQEQRAIEAVNEKARNAWKIKVDNHLQKQVCWILLRILLDSI